MAVTYNYSDTSVHRIDVETKKIENPDHQPLIVGEAKSHYIPFEVSSYLIDGIDVTGMTISVVWWNDTTLEKQVDSVINVVHNAEDTFFTFGWALGAKTAEKPGTLYFYVEIKNSDGYVWRTLDASKKINSSKIWEAANAGDVTVNSEQTVKERIEGIEEEINSLVTKSDARIDAMDSITPITGWTAGKYYRTTDDEVDMSTPVVAEGYRTVIIDCVGGDEFSVQGYIATTGILWAFVDESGKVICRSTLNTTDKFYQLTAPPTAKKLIINDGSGTDRDSYKGRMHQFGEVDEDEKNCSKVRRITGWMSGYYFNLGGTSVDFSKMSKSASYRTAVLECKHLDEFTISGDGGNSARIWCFVDGDNKVLLRSVANQSVENLVITAPYGAKKLVVTDNSYKTSYIGRTLGASKLESCTDGLASNATEYHARFDKFINDGFAKRELLVTTTNNQPVYAYLFTFETGRMLPSYKNSDVTPDTIEENAPFYYKKERICFTSGMHGNEKGASYGLYKFLERLCYDTEYEKYRMYDYYIVPLTNPNGFNATNRKNAENLSIGGDAYALKTKEAPSIVEFMKKNAPYILYVDWHQAGTKKDRISFLSQAYDTDKYIEGLVNDAFVSGGAKAMQDIHDEFGYVSKLGYVEAEEGEQLSDQGVFVWQGSEPPGIFRNFGHKVAYVSCTHETDTACQGYTNDSTYFNYNALRIGVTLQLNAFKSLLDTVPMITAYIRQCKTTVEPIKGWTYSYLINTKTSPVTLFVNDENGNQKVNASYNTSGYSYAIVPCSEGDTFIINGTGGITPRLWCFINSNGNIIASAGENAIASNLTLTAPEGSAYLILNDKTKSTSYIGGAIMKARSIEENNALALLIQKMANLCGINITDSTEYSTWRAKAGYGNVYTDNNTAPDASEGTAPDTGDEE